jgi:hypothetical protein
MPSSPRLGPKSGPLLTLTLPHPGGVLAGTCMGELTEFTIAPDKGETHGTSVQSTDADSLWAFTWQHSGEVVGYSFAPHGNTVATADEPILRGSLTVGPKPSLGGAATAGTFTFEFDWQLTDEPEFDTGDGS